MFSKILVPVDLSTDNATDNVIKDATKKLCETANDLAAKYAGEIRLMSVIPDYGMPLVASYFPDDAQDKLKQEMMQKLEKLAKDYFNVKLSIHLDQGKRIHEVLNEIENYQPDLVIIGCRPKRSRGGSHLLGSFASGISNRASCSVMIVR